jgi:hypothetical protein
MSSFNDFPEADMTTSASTCRAASHCDARRPAFYSAREPSLAEALADHAAGDIPLENTCRGQSIADFAPWQIDTIAFARRIDRASTLCAIGIITAAIIGCLLPAICMALAGGMPA